MARDRSVPAVLFLAPPVTDDPAEAAPAARPTVVERSLDPFAVTPAVEPQPHGSLTPDHR